MQEGPWQVCCRYPTVRATLALVYGCDFAAVAQAADPTNGYVCPDTTPPGVEAVWLDKWYNDSGGTNFCP